MPSPKVRLLSEVEKPLPAFRTLGECSDRGEERRGHSFLPSWCCLGVASTQSFPFSGSLVAFSDALWVIVSGKRYNLHWGSVVIPVLTWPDFGFLVRAGGPSASREGDGW